MEVLWWRCASALISPRGGTLDAGIVSRNGARLRSGDAKMQGREGNSARTLRRFLVALCGIRKACAWIVWLAVLLVCLAMSADGNEGKETEEARKLEVDG